jgi:hypothetical protein
VVQIFSALFLAVCVLHLPFSPRWQCSKGRHEEALHVLTKLREREPNDLQVHREWMHIRAEAACQEEVRKERHPKLQTGTRICYIKLEFALSMDCLKPGCMKRIHVGAGLMFFQQFIGIGAIIYYSPTLIQGMSLNSESSLIMPGVLNIIHLVRVCSNLFTMDKFGQRPLLSWDQSSCGPPSSPLVLRWGYFLGICPTWTQTKLLAGPA